METSDEYRRRLDALIERPVGRAIDWRPSRDPYDRFLQQFSPRMQALLRRDRVR